MLEDHYITLSLIQSFPKGCFKWRGRLWHLIFFSLKRFSSLPSCRAHGTLRRMLLRRKEKGVTRAVHRLILLTMLMLVERQWAGMEQETGIWITALRGARVLLRDGTAATWTVALQGVSLHYWPGPKPELVHSAQTQTDTPKQTFLCTQMVERDRERDGKDRKPQRLWETEGNQSALLPFSSSNNGVPGPLVAL